jgi:hypothetical protein
VPGVTVAKGASEKIGVVMGVSMGDGDVVKKTVVKML